MSNRGMATALTKYYYKVCELDAYASKYNMSHDRSKEVRAVIAEVYRFVPKCEYQVKDKKNLLEQLNHVLKGYEL